MKNSAINWTDHTANFWWGCFKVSDGCKNCYAETLSKRYGKSIWGPPATTQREPKLGIWKDIRMWDREAKAEGVRRRVFVSSMSDFLEDHPTANEIRPFAMGEIEKLEWLDVLMLTKRPENAYMFLRNWWDSWPEHVWFGATAENQETLTKRVWEFVGHPAKVKFLSVEPMLGSIDLSHQYTHYRNDVLTWEKWPTSRIYEHINWVICGGESGAKCRPFEWDWARSLRDQCKAANVAFWMKQGGGHPSKRHELSDIPEDLRIRELPNG